ncbi:MULTISPECIES: NAD(P)-dependent oxidoreductase [Kribbella]|uniref:NAD(P)H-binding protein n=1 Tax=Kribbella karoonensis TaxID=324851 RepID=A0ABP4NV79_9ACTN
MKLVVFGAHGGTGLHLTRQALELGHGVVAVTRRPGEFPVVHPRLTVTGGDVYEVEDVAAAVEGADAVLSALGVPFTRRPVTVYSRGTANIVAAMERHGVKRIVVISSVSTDPHPHGEAGFLMNKVIQPLVTATIGRTTYADMRRMEADLRATTLDWTVVRPAGLYDADRVTAYRLEEDRTDGFRTSRADLAASVLAQLDTTQWVHRNVAVTTSDGAPSLLQLMFGEALPRR